MDWQKVKLPFLSNDKVEFFFRWVLGILFLFSSYHKLIDPQSFGKVLLDYELFPFPLIVLGANIFPVLEIVCGLSLIFGVFPKEASLILVGMLILFIFVLTFNLYRGVEHDCGCFSSENTESPFPLWMIIIRNLFLLSMGIFVYRFSGKRIASLKA